MPARYLLGDVFVLPSEGRHETWGLAVNEAMHLSRPAILSDHVGCHPDLLVSGETGWLFPAGDETALARVLREALSLPREKIAALGRAAAARVAGFNHEAATAGLLAAIDGLPTR
jgi:glycosyltransferase involved in cell wall biosynthesis